ncbi:MAG: hypothetical protein ACPGUV_06040 [Polyangiales bacterium]
MSHPLSHIRRHALTWFLLLGSFATSACASAEPGDEDEGAEVEEDGRRSNGRTANRRYSSIEQKNGQCPDDPQVLTGEGEVGDDCGDEKDCKPHCCDCESDASWLAAACIQGECASEAAACEETGDPDNVEDPNPQGGLCEMKGSNLVQLACTVANISTRGFANGCAACIAANCCTPFEACLNKASCIGAVGCLTGCDVFIGRPGDLALCKAGCTTLGLIGSQSRLSALNSCVNSSCDRECNELLQ